MTLRMMRSPAVAGMLARALGAYLSFALHTTRWTIEGGEHLAPFLPEDAVVVTVWHESLPLMPALWLRARRRYPEREVAALASRHRDGRFLGAIMARFGLAIVHGSTAKAGPGGDKGGAAGLRALLAVLQRGGAVVITPDGPRGPRRVAAPGAAQLAALTGAPILAAHGCVRWGLTLGSWDRMVVPLPFGRGALVCRPPIAVAADGAEAAGPVMEAAMGAAAERAAQLCTGSRGRLAQILWALVASAARPGLRIMLRRRLGRGKEIAGRLGERRGVETVSRPEGRLLWLHAASVGEALAALPILGALPDCVSVLFTTGTVTSAALLAERLPAMGLADRVRHRFVPLDVPPWIGRFLDHWRPDAACFLEGELWPNIFAACRKRSIPLALVNARMSARSAAAWARVPGLAASMLGGVAFVSARSARDAERLAALGALRVTADGDLKLSAEVLPCDERERGRLAAVIGARPLLLGASTHPGEEALIARVHQRLAKAHPGLLTAIVPRHPGRGVELAAALGAPARSRGEDPPDGGLWIADTLGELGLFYRLFPTVLMGKSFYAPGGGQNPLEPARLGCSIAIGPLHANFEEMVGLLQDTGTLAVTADEAALEAWAGAMFAGQMRREPPVGLADHGLAQRLAARIVGLMAEAS